MILNKLQKIKNINSITFKDKVSDLLKYFPYYDIVFKEGCVLWIHKDNPDQNDLENPEIMDTIECNNDMYFALKNCRHSSFNFRCFHHKDDAYIYGGVYYYANYNADKLFFMLTTDTKDQYFSYKDWSYQHKDNDYNHNYKIDKEDLLKLGIEV